MERAMVPLKNGLMNLLPDPAIHSYWDRPPYAYTHLFSDYATQLCNSRNSGTICVSCRLTASGSYLSSSGGLSSLARSDSRAALPARRPDCCTLAFASLLPIHSNRCLLRYDPLGRVTLNSLSPTPMPRSNYNLFHDCTSQTDVVVSDAPLYIPHC